MIPPDLQARLLQKATLLSNRGVVQLTRRDNAGQVTSEVDLSRAERILVVRLDEIGDMVLTGPMLRILRRAAPSARITLVAKPLLRDAMAACPSINEVIAMEDRPGGLPTARIAAARSMAERINARSPVTVAILPRWDTDNGNGSLLCWATGAPVRIAYSETVNATKAVMNEGYDRLFTHTVHTLPGMHEVERNVNVLKPLLVGREVHAGPLERWVTDGESSDARSLLRERLGGTAEAPVIALGIGAGAPQRVWPAARYAQVIAALPTARFVLIGAGGEVESAARIAILAAASDRVLNLADQLSLKESAAVLTACTLFIGSDSGPMHLAAAAGLPCVEISCHPLAGDPEHENSPCRFGPWGVPSLVLQPARPAPGCQRYCAAREPHCICGVTADRVVDAAAQLIGARDPSPPERARA